MNWPAILAPLLAPNFLVTLAVIVCATVLLAFDCIDAAMWWTAVAGAGAIFTVRGNVMDRDLNAAINLKNKAVSSTVTACGEDGSGRGGNTATKPASVKQEDLSTSC